MSHPFYRSFLIGLLLAAGLVSGGLVYAQKPERTPIPYDKDPNAPGLSRQERLELQRELIKHRWEERKQLKLKKDKKKPKPSKPKKGDPKKPDKKEDQKVKPAVPKKEPDDEKNDKSLTGNRPYATFYMSPSTVIKTVGDTFHTDCRIMNQGHLPIDDIEIRLDYPSRALKPLGIHQDHILDLLDGEPKVEVDSETGSIIYRAKLKKPVDSIEATLLTIEWEAVRQGRGLPIRPEVDGRYSRLCWGGTCQNQSSLGMDKSNLGAFVHVRLPGETEGGPEKIVESVFEALLPSMTDYVDQRYLRPPSLWIDQPAEGELQAGDWLVIDIGLNNPDNMIFDELRLAIEYDPASVEIADTDKMNTIISGINILDGPFRDTWTWDYHMVNEVNPGRGMIDYRMGQRELAPQPSGVIARVFARITQQVEAPVLHWSYDADKSMQRPTTDIYLLDQSVYMLNGDDQLPAQAMRAKPNMLSDPDAYERADPSQYRF